MVYLLNQAETKLLGDSQHDRRRTMNISLSPTPEAKPVRRRPTTRAQLIDAAAALFREQGTTNVSVEAICTRAGFTRGAFYSSFKTVDELFFALYEERSKGVEQHLASLFPAAGQQFNADSVETIVHDVLAALPADQEWFAIRAVFMAQATHRPDIAERLHEHAERFRSAFQPLLIRTVEALGRRLTVDPEIFTRAVIAAHIGAVSHGTIYGDLSALREATVRGVLLGLTT